METKTAKIVISIPDNLLNNFDDIIGKKGYSCRSEAIRDAISSYISCYEWMCNIEGIQIGALSVIYDRTKRGLSDTLIDIQRQYSHVIKSSMHIHNDQKNFYEIIILDGKADEVKELTEAIMTLKGVKISNLTTVASK